MVSMKCGAGFAAALTAAWLGLLLPVSRVDATAMPAIHLEQEQPTVPPATTRATPPPPPLRAAVVLPCLAATDTSACLVEAIERAQPATRRAMTLPSIADLGPWGLGPKDDWVSVYSQMLSDSRAGQAPDAVLKAADSLTPAARLQLLVRLCHDGVPPISATSGRQYQTWRQSLAPSRPLMKASADALEATVNAGGLPPAAITFSAEMLGVCRGQLGDTAGMNRAIALAWPAGSVGGRLAILVLGGRTDEALAYSETFKPGDPKVKAAADWVALEQGRGSLLKMAVAAGQLQIADRTAEDMMAAALAPDRPTTPTLDSGAPTALAWLVWRQTSPATAAWIDKADAFARPSQPGWNLADAIAVHRAWLALGRTDRALALYDQVAAAAAQPPAPSSAAPPPAGMTPKQANAQRLAQAGRPSARQAMGEMLAASSYWDQGLALGESASDVSRVDWQIGAGEANLSDRLARAVAPLDKAGVLQICAVVAGQSIFDRWRPGGGAPPVEVAAKCAHDLVSLDLGPQAPWLPRADAALLVAMRAGQFDRADIDRDMIALYLKTTQAGPQPVDLDWQKTLILLDAARDDLHARGKL